MKEELKKNTTKMAKAMGAEIQEGEDEGQEDESWWVRPLVTMLCLAMIGALSLARLAMDATRAWLNGRRAHEEIIEEKQDEREYGQAGEPRVRNEEEAAKWTKNR